ncbi:SCP-2 sterol transfer family protein [Micromonospora pallida]|uniref:SCP-2 sterol transfer family protein n=1 Tax=Micromonospora pallida TaxID=145854 RepID=A0A1C6TJC4_9ACTN|nr:SCP2 sterol-binding domain-containing protein [Micromonospora pallida]SCL41645.1 SCP-2 sterol transfer family protein [Micromonospora pallida]
MADAITRFFEELNRRGFEPLLETTSGTVRFDLHEGARTTHWLLDIDRGRVRVDQEDREADTVIGMNPTLFEQLVTGREDGIASMLRGDLTVSGDHGLMARIERLFPSAPGTRGPRRVDVREVS